jgi:hypothetical protein
MVNQISYLNASNVFTIGSGQTAGGWNKAKGQHKTQYLSVHKFTIRTAAPKKDYCMAMQELEDQTMFLSALVTAQNVKKTLAFQISLLPALFPIIRIDHHPIIRY